jgi:23S rRNA (uridine2552-2'-O)-methyltransferase
VAPAVTDRRHGGPGGAKAGTKAGGRGQAVRVKTARRRRPSSTRWLERQLNDPYVADARRLGLRSRAAFKLLQLDERFNLLSPGKRVVDLGAAPGGWTQIAIARVALPASAKASAGPPSIARRATEGRVVAIDLSPMDPVPGAIVLQRDVRDADTIAAIREALGGPADLVLSDMAPPATGHAQTDHLRIVALAELAYDSAVELLAPGGDFVCKVLQGGAQGDLLAALKRDFTTVRHVKPPASRTDSAEVYLIAQGFRRPPA